MKKNPIMLIGIILISNISVSYVAAQSSRKKISEYYFNTPLAEVINDFINKYGYDIEYDTALVAQYDFTDGGRFRPSISITGALEAIKSDFPNIDFTVQDNGKILLYSSAEYARRQFMENAKFNGPPTRKNLKISGIIKDIETGESLPFASISVKGSTNGTTSNHDGFFTLFKVPSDTSALQISYVGYESAVFYLNPEVDIKEIQVFLQAEAKTLEAIVIEGERDDLMRTTDEISTIKMSPSKIAALPNIGEKDIFRSFQLLPGVSASNEGSSGLYVRGGTPDQNLILYDGFTVYQVDHLFGMFSAFNSNAVKDVQLYKGGFEAHYGGRISSVMEIVGKDGNENNFNIGGDIGLLSANMYVELPIADKITFLVAGRRSWKSSLYNNIFDKFSESTETTTAIGQGAAGGPGGRGGRFAEEITPTSYFYDLNSKLSFKPNNKDIISVSFFNGQDNLDNSRSIDRAFGTQSVSGSTTDLTKWGNWGVSTVWSRQWNETYYSSLLGSVSNYYSLRDRQSERSTINDFGETETEIRGSYEDNDLKDYTIKLDNELKLGARNLAEFGIQSSFYDINYDFTLDGSTIIQDRHDLGYIASAYIQDKINIFENFTITPGFRASYYDITAKLYSEPRLGLNLKLTDEIILKGAWGIYYQFANRIIRNDISSGSRDFWVLSDDTTIPVSSAEHFILGASYENNDYLFSVESYLKNLDGLSEYSLQFTPSFNNVDFNEFFYRGSGIAKGVEFLAQKKTGRYNGWVGYTLGQVLYNFPIYGEDDFPANHDVTHEFKIVNTYILNRWSFSATWIYGTGKPYTDPTGGYTVTMADGTEQDYLYIGAKNNARYPDYHRLDVSAKLGLTFGKSTGSISFSVYNFYNRSNTWYKEFELEDDGSLVETDITLLGITPSITFSFNLR